MSYVEYKLRLEKDHFSAWVDGEIVAVSKSTNDLLKFINDIWITHCNGDSYLQVVKNPTRRNEKTKKSI